MESNKIPSIKTQIAIVNTLLDGSPKPQRKIAEEIGKEESTISKAIGYLKKANVVDIVPQSIKSGGRSNTGMYPNNLCSLTYDLDHGMNILLFFKSVLTLKFLKESETEDIINTLQKSDKILSMLSETHKMSCVYKAGLPQAETSDRGMSISKPEIDKAMEDFKEQLTLSPTFFEACLNNDSGDLHNKHALIFSIFEGKFTPDSILINKYNGLVLDRLFEACVISDILKGNEPLEAVGYLQEKNQQLKISSIPASSLSSQVRA